MCFVCIIFISAVVLVAAIRVLHVRLSVCLCRFLCFLRTAYSNLLWSRGSWDNVSVILKCLARILQWR